MSFRSLLLWISISALIFFVDAAEMVALSLSKACSLALEKNVSIKNQKLDLQKNMWQRRDAVGKLLPKIEGYSSFNCYYAIPKVLLPGEILGGSGMIPVEFGTNYDWSTGLKATQILYNQAVFTGIKISKRISELGELSIQQKQEEIIYQVARVYYMCLAVSGQLNLSLVSMKNLEQLLDIAKTQALNGIIRKVDYSQILVNKLNLQTQIDNLNRLYQEQVGMLRYLLDIDPAISVELTDSLTSNVNAVRINNEVSSRIELRLLDSRIQIAELNLKLVKSFYLPSLSFFVNHYYQSQRNDPDFFDSYPEHFFSNGLVGFNLSVPIFNGLGMRYAIRQSNIELEQLRNSYKDTRNYQVKESADALRVYQTILCALKRQNETIHTAGQNYEVQLQGYRQSVISLSELLLSESSLTEARLSYFNSLLQLQNAMLDLYRTDGRLLLSIVK